MAELLKSWFPHTAAPFICSAPMWTVSGPELAIAVTKAGGQGFYAGGWELGNLGAALSSMRASFALQQTDVLPIGVGVIVWCASLPLAIAAFEKQRPAALWLFAPKDANEMEAWIGGVKSAYPEIKIFVQLGSVAEAERILEGKEGGNVDVIVAQGVADAGGHGVLQGASVMTLVPEMVELVERVGRKVPVLAAGGIVDGRGVAAALALGASGAVMGTRLIASNESQAPDGFKNYIIGTKDGGQSTIRSRLYDSLRVNDWPPQYNGRSVINSSFRDHEQGLDKKKNIELYKEAVQKMDYERLTIYAGTGVGLVNSVLPAEEIVKNTRNEALSIIQNMAARYQGIALPGVQLERL